MAERCEVEFNVNVSGNTYEVKYASGGYVKSPITGDDLIVQLGTGDYSGVEITSSGTTDQLSFTAWGEPYLGGNNFSDEYSVAFFSSTIHLIIVESGFSYLGEAVGGGGCGFTIC